MMKKLIISSDQLKPALKKLGQAVNEKNILPVLTNVYFYVSKGSLEMITSDSELTISYKCEVEADQEFEVLLPYDFLNKIVGVTKSEPVTIEHPSTRKARIITTDDVYELNSLDKLEDYPKLPTTPKRNTLILPDNFVELLGKAMLTCSKLEGRPALTRACLDIQKESTHLVSTDAYFMYKHKLDLQLPEPIQIQFSSRMAKAIEGLEKIELSWTSNVICLKTDKLTVWCRKFEDKYPNYNSIIPGHGPNLIIDKANLEELLHKACITSNTAKETLIHLDKGDGCIHFETDDKEYNRKITGKKPATYTGTTSQIAINSKKLLTMMDQVDAKELRLHINVPATAILVSTPDDENYLGLLMPLNINQ